MKLRTQIQLDPEDHRALKSWAHQRGISISAAVRWLIRKHLLEGEPGHDEATAGFVSAAGAIPGGPDEGEVSLEHDRFLYGEGTDS